MRELLQYRSDGFRLSVRKSLMTDLGAIAIVLACFAVLFTILYALDRI
jgi:hypothetical protein